MHEQGSLGDAQPGAAELLRHRDAQVARIRHRAMELEGKIPAAVVREPVVVVERGAQAIHAVHDGLLLVGEGEIHARR